jgi:hypothetical protein
MNTNTNTDNNQEINFTLLQKQGWEFSSWEMANGFECKSPRMKDMHFFEGATMRELNSWECELVLQECWDEILKDVKKQFDKERENLLSVIQNGDRPLSIPHYKILTK